MIKLPDTIKQIIEERRESLAATIQEANRELDREDVKASLNFAAYLVVAEGEDGLDGESIVEDYQKFYDAPIEDIAGEIAEAMKKGWIEPRSSATSVWETQYLVTRQLWRRLHY